MDDKRFDHLTRLVGRGASRRSILKGLLGLGGAAVAGTVASDGVDARRVTSSSRIPPPPPPVCPTGEQECGGTGSAFCCPYGKCNTAGNPDVCCDGPGEAFCGTGCCADACTDTGICCDPGLEACRSICCPTGACARDGNTDFCCTAPRFACGLDCCADELQCCDGECCPEGTACLTKAFYGESPAVEEETCCDIDQTCDGQCCAGTCFWPLAGQVGVATVLDIFDRECCPATEGVTFCPGQGQFSTFGACCEGETPHCCHDSLGRPVCISEAQCCTTDECVEVGFDRDCIVCNIDTNACEPANENTTCTEFECGICLSGHCAPEESLCFTCEQCSDELRCVPDCRPSTCGCPQCQTCNQDTGICEPLCGAGQNCCSGVCFDDACCTIEACVAAGFDRDCVTCDVATNTCIPANENTTCVEFECGFCQSGNCAPDEALCFACEQCSEETLRCVPDCRGGGCGCPTCQTCNQDTGVCDSVASDPSCSTGCCNGVCCPANQSCIGNVCQPACLTVQSVCDAFAPTCCQDVPTTCSFEANCTTIQGEARCCRPIGEACSVRCDCCDNADCTGGTCQLDTGQQCVSDDECGGTIPDCCGGNCRDLDNDVNNCGGCGFDCPDATNPGEIVTCIQGSCGVACADGFTLCGVFCVLLDSDENNCGTCGNDCASGETCCFGTCRDLNTDENSCGECGALCPGTCCGGECEDLLLDVLNCGECGRNCFMLLCGDPSSCPGMRPGCCSGGCFDLASDNQNCNECSRICGLTFECQDGACLPA